MGPSQPRYAGQPAPSPDVERSPMTFTDRVSNVAGRLRDACTSLENQLARIRGAHPSAVDKPQTGAVPTLDSACHALEGRLDDLESLVRELDTKF